MAITKENRRTTYLPILVDGKYNRWRLDRVQIKILNLKSQLVHSYVRKDRVMAHATHPP